MIYIKRNSAQGVNVTRNNKSRIIICNQDISVEPVSRSVQMNDPNNNYFLETSMNDSTQKIKVTLLNVNCMDSHPSNLWKSIKFNFIQMKFQAIDYNLFKFDEFIVHYEVYAIDNLDVNQNGECVYLQIYIPGYICIDVGLRTVSYSISSHDYDYEDTKIDTHHDYDHDYSKSHLSSTLASGVTQESTADYDYFIDDDLESTDEDEDDYEEPEDITYHWYDYYEKDVTTFSTVSTTIDVEELQTDIIFTPTSEEIDVTSFVTLAPIIETSTLIMISVITETSTIVTTTSTTESTTKITQTLSPAMTTEFTILTIISSSTTSESTTEATSMTTEYTNTSISTTEITTTEFLPVEEKTTWMENVTELLLPEETGLMTTDYLMKTSVTMQPTMTSKTSQITLITENVTVTELMMETTKIETGISEIITTTTFTSIELITSSYTTEKTIGSVYLESTTLSIKKEEWPETYTTETVHTTFIFTPEIIINITIEESSAETLPTSTTYSLIESSLETSTVTIESETYIFPTTLVTFSTYYIDRTSILETTVPLPFTMSTEMITLTEDIFEPTSVTTQSSSLIFTKSTSTPSVIIKSTYSFTISSFETFTTETYIFPTTLTFTDQILESTIPLPSTILPEIITLMEDIVEPTSTTTFLTLTKFSKFLLLSEIDTSSTSIYSITTYTKLEEETSTMVDIISQFLTSTFSTFQEITLPDFEITSTKLDEETLAFLTTPLIDIFLSETYTSTPIPFVHTTIPMSFEATTTEDFVLFLARSTTIDMFTTIEFSKTLKTMSAEKMQMETDSLEYEEFYDEEYGEDYKQTYEENEYEDENKSITSWYDYEEEEETKKLFDLKTTQKFETTEIIEEEITNEIIERTTFPTVSSTAKFTPTEMYPTLSQIITITIIEKYKTSTTISTIKDFEKTLTTKLLTSPIPTIEEYTLTTEKVMTYTTEHLEWWTDQSFLTKHDHTLSEFEIDPKTKLDVTLPKFIYSPDETITGSSVHLEIEVATDKYFKEETQLGFSENNKIRGETGKEEMLRDLISEIKTLEKRMEDITKMEEEQDKREKEWEEKKRSKDLKSIVDITYPDIFPKSIIDETQTIETSSSDSINYTLTELPYSRSEFDEKTDKEMTSLFETSEEKSTVHSFEEDEDEVEDITRKLASPLTTLTNNLSFESTFKPPIESEKFTPAPPTEKTTSMLQNLNRVTIIPKKCNKKKRKKVRKGEDYTGM
ncbi:PREDICTED: flocculation protein FLO11-like [Polistes canadensis]|uniref:flocculation protein FLO11-like n=1 Tax=Polistes canadensis TaxID=91411 RepID=UPI000718C450|nr:PREDICTED: flocculation protein FLO11-like [Polistes canadensis]